MKKTYIISLATLALAVIVLFVLHFTGWGKPEGKKAEHSVGPGLPDVTLQVAFVNMDSIIANYDYYIVLRDELLAKQEKSGAELKSKFDTWQRQATKLEDDRQKLLITSKTYEETGQRLVKERENLLQLQQNLSQELLEEEQVMNRKVYFAIIDYLKEYNKDGRYQFILSSSLGGSVLYASESLDHTAIVLEALNNRYRADKK